LEACDPKLPQGAYNRLADNWRPLFAVAQVAGADWPQRAAAAFAQFTSWGNQDVQGIGGMLLADIASVFSAAGVDKLPSAKLTAALADFEGRPWPEFGPGRKRISPNQLAVQLDKFGIAPQKWRNGNGTERGYVRADFEQVFERFLPEGDAAKRHNATTVVNKGDSGPSQSPQQGEFWQL
jgi:hypothetical protein